MKKPRFEIAESVYHGQKKVRIAELINADDPSDVKLQGFRYIVLSRGQHWSVPESSLSLSPRKIA